MILPFAGPKRLVSNRTKACSMYTTWDINFTAEGKLDIFKNGELIHRSVPIAWLERQLALYDCGERLQERGSASERHG
jgi:hypothetical protein